MLSSERTNLTLECYRLRDRYQFVIHLSHFSCIASLKICYLELLKIK